MSEVNNQAGSPVVLAEAAASSAVQPAVPGANNFNLIPSPASNPITLTDAAALKLQQIIIEENNPNLKLRISITGGGCSGFQYAFDLDEVAQETDMLIQKNIQDASVSMLVDPMSLMYLTGAEIDFKQTAAGEEFVIRNPHAKTTCGCGSSFSI